MCATTCFHSTERRNKREPKCYKPCTGAVSGSIARLVSYMNAGPLSSSYIFR